jgi:hypothetical protein
VRSANRGKYRMSVVFVLCGAQDPLCELKKKNEDRW